jgi:hypothetical protein
MFLNMHSTPQKRTRGNTIEKIDQKPPTISHPPPLHTKKHSFPLTPMQLVSLLTTKQWGQVNKATLHQLIVKRKVHIKDLSNENENINAVHVH